MKKAAKLVIALDVPNASDALKIACLFSDLPVWMKVGLELFTAEGPSVVRAISQAGLPVFLDMKFHDIPNTVAGAVSSATAIGVSMITLHICGGSEMAKAAVAARDKTATQLGITPPVLLGITVLTSMQSAKGKSMTTLVVERALEAKQAGLNGIVCSGLEVEAVKNACGKDFICLCPGIRFAGSATDDQARVCTPQNAVQAGADFLVMGRPILRAPNPHEAAIQAIGEMTIGG